MNKQFLQFMRLTLISLDFLILNLVFFINFFSIIHSDGPFFETSNKYFLFWAFVNINWIFSGWFLGLYRDKNIISFENFFKKTVRAYGLWLICCLFIFIALLKDKSLLKDRSFLVGLTVCYSLGLFVMRFLYLQIRAFFKGKGLLKKILIIGYNDSSKKLAEYFENEGINAEILGFTENEQNVEELSHYPIMSNIESSIEVAKKHQADEIFSTVTPEQDKKIYQLIEQADRECIRFRIVPDFSLFIKYRQVHVSHINDMPILLLRNEAIDDINSKIKKRVFDIVVSSLVILFILSWLIPLLSILIRLESKGPVFFTQMRTGKNKKSFPCYKFRSMYVNKDSDLKQATKGDNRITKIGAFLRRTSVDEFPQFLNVFIGTMSIVGPRPHMVKHTDDYSKIVDQYMVRHFSKPGITGWAQINGYRGEVNDLHQIRNRVEYDIWYMENWNLLLDLKIVFYTIFNILKGEEKAY